MNKLRLDINYIYYNDRYGDREELHPMSFLNSFNPNTVLKSIEDILHYVFVRGKRKEKYWSRYNGKYMGKQYFTYILIRRLKLGSEIKDTSERWVLETYIFDDYISWKDGLSKKSKKYNGYVFYSLTQLLNKVFEICGEWDKEVFEESLGKCLKPHLNRHNIKSFDELYEKCRKCDDEIVKWEKEFRKLKFEKDKEINEVFETVGKEWVEE